MPPSSRCFGVCGLVVMLGALACTEESVPESTPDAGEMVTGEWRPVSATDAPPAGLDQMAVWTGSEVIVWDGNGARFRPSENRWIPMTSEGHPPGRSYADAIWTGTHMAFFGGSNCHPSTGNSSFCDGGATYDPAADRWSPISRLRAPAPRAEHTTIWTGTHMIVWGGRASNLQAELQDGGAYDPVTDTWSEISPQGAAHPRTDHTAVWTGREMIVFGGYQTEPPTSPVTGRPRIYLAAGTAYDPAAKTWRVISSVGAPSPRHGHHAVWTGSEMIIWGGWGCNGPHAPLQRTPIYCEARAYDPAADQWRTVPAAPLAPRHYASAVWTGTEILVWGGLHDKADPCVSLDAESRCADGAFYDPALDRWTRMVAVPRELGRGEHVGIWTGDALFVWSGTQPRLRIPVRDGFLYRP